MSTGSAPSRVVPAVIGGVATTAYYASPDFIPSRRLRGWAKAGLLAVTLATSVPELRAARAARFAAAAEGSATAQESATADAPADGEAPVSPSQVLGSLSTGKKALLAGIAALAVAGSFAGLTAMERWIFRRGQARAAAGKRLPHTAPALVLGALTAATALIPSPSDDD